MELIQLKNNFNEYILYDKMLFEVRGYNSHSKLIEDAVLDRITESEFDEILNEYLQEAFLQDIKSVMNGVILPLLKNAISWIGKIGTKSINIIIKILDVILKFKQKHPLLFYSILCIIFMILISIISDGTHAAVKNPSGKTMSRDEIDTVIGAMEKISQGGDRTSELALEIGKFQSELIKGRDNPEYLVDLAKDGKFKIFYEKSMQFLSNVKSDVSILQYKQFIEKLISIGKSMQITIF